MHDAVLIRFAGQILGVSGQLLFENGHQALVEAAVGRDGEVTAKPFESSVRNYYMTDPISRASPTMAECSGLQASNGEKTGTDG